jgi:hypothetical protein
MNGIKLQLPNQAMAVQRDKIQIPDMFARFLKEASELAVACSQTRRITSMTSPAKGQRLHARNIAQ